MEVNTEVSHSTHHRTHIYYVAPCGRRLVSVTVIVQVMMSFVYSVPLLKWTSTVSISVYVCLSVCLSVGLSVCLSLCLYICVRCCVHVCGVIIPSLTVSLTETKYLTIDQFCYNSSIAININPISRPTVSLFVHN